MDESKNESKEVLTQYWEDLRVAATMVQVGGSQRTAAPQFRQSYHHSERGPSYSGLYDYVFEFGKNGAGLFQNAYFTAQLPHTYAEGTAIEPHVHVTLQPCDEAEPGQKLLLEFEYIWTNLNEKKPASTTIIPLNHEVTQEELEADNILISFGLIEKPEAGISSMLDCRFSRITLDPDWNTEFWIKRSLSNDTFQGNLLFKEFDFHYRKSSPGSREIYTK